jgi:hypothetical protein
MSESNKLKKVCEIVDLYELIDSLDFPAKFRLKLHSG